MGQTRMECAGPKCCINRWNNCFTKAKNLRTGTIFKDIQSDLRRQLSQDLIENNIQYNTIGVVVLITPAEEDAVGEEVLLNSFLSSITASNGTVEDVVSIETDTDSGIYSIEGTVSKISFVLSNSGQEGIQKSRDTVQQDRETVC